MILLTGLVGVLLVLTAEAKVGKSQGTKCIETRECLVYELLCETEDYEVRRYRPVKWVSTKEKSWFMDVAIMKAFKRLFNYITGENAEGKKIEMTAPVVVTIPEVEYWWQEGVYTLSFLLPSEYQKNPPRPNNTEVEIHETPQMDVYVKSYGGWMYCLTDKYYASSLIGALKFAGVKYEEGYHYGVGYNSPMTLLDRHNEVWVKVKGDPPCSSSEEMFE